MIFLRNILRAPIRSLLTALGVAAGIGLYVAVTAITRDIHRQVDGVAAAYGLEVVVYERRATSPFSSRLSAAQVTALEAEFGGVVPMVLGTHNERWSAYALVIGAPEEFLRRLALVAGDPLGGAEEEALVGEVAAARLGVAPGATVPIDGRSLAIRGVYRTGSRLLDGGLMMPLAGARAILAREDAEPVFTLALLRAGAGDSATAVIRAIEARHPALRAIRGTEFGGALRLMRVVDAFVRTISVVALLGACLVVGNALVMALAERTRELGILMAVGWTPVLVLRMLLAESLALCAAGAGLGVLLAMVVLRILNGIESIGFGWIPVTIPGGLALVALALGAGIALLAMAWPAFVLARLQPLAALRHE